MSITQELRRVSGWHLMGDPTEAHGQCLQSLPKRKPLGANLLPGDMWITAQLYGNRTCHGWGANGDDASLWSEMDLDPALGLQHPTQEALCKRMGWLETPRSLLGSDIMPALARISACPMHCQEHHLLKQHQQNVWQTYWHMFTRESRCLCHHYSWPGTRKRGACRCKLFTWL